MKLLYQSLLFVLPLAAGSVALGQKSKAGWQLSGTIMGKDTGKVMLQHAGEKEIRDSTQLVNGKFVFRRPAASAALYFISLPGLPGQRAAAVFADNKHIQFTASSDSLYAAVVSGSAADSVYRAFWKGFMQRNREGAATNARLNKRYSETKPNTPERQQVADSMKLFLGAFNTWMQDFVSNNSSSPSASYILYDRFIGFGDYESAKALFSGFTPTATNSYYGKKVADALALAAKSDIGQTVSFTQPDTSGKKVTLSALRAKYILVDFWASWCGPCRRENPNVVAAYNKYHNKGFDIVGISLDDKKAPWLAAIKKDGLAWTHVSDLKGWKNEIAIKYGITSVPTSFLVDSKGKIVAKNLRGEQLHQELERLLGE